MNENKMSFDELIKTVEAIQNELNERLVFALNNCSEPIILSIVNLYDARRTDNIVFNPIKINVCKKVDIPLTTAHVYSSST